MSSHIYSVQYVLPVDNPVNNVSKRRTKTGWEFLVPINHPRAHEMGFSDLIAAADLSGLIHLSTAHNKKSSSGTWNAAIKERLTSADLIRKLGK